MTLRSFDEKNKALTVLAIACFYPENAIITSIYQRDFAPYRQSFAEKHTETHTFAPRIRMYIFGPFKQYAYVFV